MASMAMLNNQRVIVATYLEIGTGWPLNHLNGAENTGLRCPPRMAISVFFG